MELNFKKIGESGTPLVVLHGVFGFLDNWLTISKSVSSQGYQLFLLDQRNHGRSPHKAPLDFPTFAEDLHEFLQQQKLEKPILLGHSMGGKTVMEYAVTFPDTYEKLIIVDIAPKAYPVHHTRLLQGLNAIPVEKLETRQEADDILAEYEPVLGVRQFLLKNLYRKDEGVFGWRFNLPLLTTDMPRIGAAVSPGAEVNAPTLFIRGEQSDYILDEDWAEILKLFPKAQLETIAGAGHWIQADQPKSFVAALLNFLQS